MRQVARISSISIVFFCSIACGFFGSGTEEPYVALCEEGGTTEDWLKSKFPDGNAQSVDSWAKSMTFPTRVLICPERGESHKAKLHYMAFGHISGDSYDREHLGIYGEPPYMVAKIKTMVFNYEIQEEPRLRAEFDLAYKVRRR